MSSAYVFFSFIEIPPDAFFILYGLLTEKSINFFKFLDKLYKRGSQERIVWNMDGLKDLIVVYKKRISE
jgi:hypothetical protein